MDLAFWCKLGLIGGLPSTVVVSLLFIGLTQTPLAAAETTTLMPLTQGINGIFVIVYLLRVRQGLAAGLLSGLCVWLILAGSFAALGIQQFWVSLGGWVLLAVGCYGVAQRWIAVPPRLEISFRCTRSQLGARALLGGTVIALAVWTGKLFGPVYGGISAAFPATFFSTLAITYRTGGAEFSRAVGRAMMMSGMINAALYTIAVRYLYAWCGLILGTALGLAFSGVTGYMTYHLLRAGPPSPPS